MTAVEVGQDQTRPKAVDRFVDVDIDTLNMDVKQLEKALTPKTRLVALLNKWCKELARLIS